MVIEVNIPNYGNLKLKFLVMDMNGTIANNGIINPRLKEYFDALSKNLKLYIVTADTFGTVAEMAREFNIDHHLLPKKTLESIEKLEFIRELGPENVIALGNGNNDVMMLKEAIVGIGIIGKEGISKDCLISADILVHDVIDALEIIIKPEKLKATLRK
ncbi:MAG: HAD family hydrolase [Promethearchaeota archaeon]